MLSKRRDTRSRGRGKNDVSHKLKIGNREGTGKANSFARRLQIRREKASLRKEAFPDSAGDQLDTTKQSVPGLFLFRTAHGERWLCVPGQDIISRLHERHRSEAHTSELQSLMLISYAAFS